PCSVSSDSSQLSLCVLLLLPCVPRSLGGIPQQLQQDQTYRTGEVMDSCVGDFSAAGDRIIRAKDSIEQGATFLLARTGCGASRGPKAARDSLRCYLFNCTYRSKNVCAFSAQKGFTTYSRTPNTTQGHLLFHLATQPGDVDEPPRSDAGQDVVIQLPTDWAVLDGRDNTAINMKSTHPGLLKISGLQEGVYTFQMTVTDTAGQKSSDNISVTVLAPKHQAEVYSSGEVWKLICRPKGFQG
uniref:Low density lipoprotein receptor-related protein 11 n=1 Tax=Maylandia zebra TaxID=106582 RepID=A0A3P9C5Z3_9CICH